MKRYYVITHPVYGEIVKQDDNITAARAWVKRAFPKDACTVHPERQYKFCSDCQSSPCCCMVRADA